VSRFFFDNALLPSGWVKNVCIDTDTDGWISGITQGITVSDADHYDHIAIPGMPNLHSHAFQRAMAGRAEIKGPNDDNFWTWRQAMYQFVEQLNPDDLKVIARLLYVEMLEAGYTSVAEFHYLHHTPSGHPYDDIGEMASAIATAAGTSGIGLTFLPVFYANGGFGGKPSTDGQRRFTNTPDRYADLFNRIQALSQTLPDANVGIAPHSLRAVTPESLSDILALANNVPIHIHIAEQTKEVEECLAWSGQRSVEWLLDKTDVNQHWCLIHATHLTATERQGIATSGAVAGLCPITEANLGDGIFDGVAFINDGGQFGIGSDSNVYISVAEELRLLEYSQRLRDQGRNLLAGAGATGRSLFSRAVVGGAQAVGRKIGQLASGYRADIVALDQDHPSLAGHDGDGWLDAWIFAADNQAVSNVWVGGHHVVCDGRHSDRDPARRDFNKTIARLLSV